MMKIQLMAAVALFLTLLAAPAWAQTLDLDADRAAYLRKSQDETGKLDAGRKAYLNEKHILMMGPVIKTDQKTAAAKDKNDGDLPTGPSDANRSDAPIKPLPADMIRGGQKPEEDIYDPFAAPGSAKTQ